MENKLTTWIHDIPENVDPEALLFIAGGSANWFPRQTLVHIQQGAFTV